MKITEKVHMLDGTDASHAFLAFTPEPVLIDTGFPLQRKGLLNALDALGVKLTDLKYIIFTHHDIDHIGNAVALQQLTGASLWASADDIPYITGEKPREGFKKLIGRVQRHKPANVHAFENSTISGIQVIPTPGHTQGHVCFLFDGVLFAGDLFENKKKGLIPYPNLNWNNDMLSDSAKKIAALDFEWLCPAHGDPVRREGQTILNG